MKRFALKTQFCVPPNEAGLPNTLGICGGWKQWLSLTNVAFQNTLQIWSVTWLTGATTTGQTLPRPQP